VLGLALFTVILKSRLSESCAADVLSAVTYFDAVLDKMSDGMQLPERFKGKPRLIAPSLVIH
jgi:hypothetical protein